MTSTLLELCDIRTGYQFRKGVGNEVPAGDLVHVIQLRDLNNGALNPECLERVLIKSAEKYLVKPDDVLFLARGQRFTATHVTEVQEQTIAVHFFLILRVRQPELILPQYLAWSLNHPKTQDYLMTRARQTHIPFVSTSEVKTLQVAIPPVSAQQKIIDLDEAKKQEAFLTTKLLEKRAQFVDEITWNLAQKTTENNLDPQQK